jgi:hypothetical protein
MMNPAPTGFATTSVVPSQSLATVSLSGKLKAGLLLLVGSLCEVLGMMFS